MSFYKERVEPLLRNRDSEKWHTRAREALHLAEQTPLTLKLLELFAYRHRRFSDPRLAVYLGGSEIKLDNPVMVGAGWDKLGHAVKALYKLGFSGVEVGTALAFPQPGNEKPRQFMIGPGVCLNRLGFNSPGMEAIAQNLEMYKNSGIPVGVSLGINKDIPEVLAPEAYEMVTETLYPYADYLKINVSSPNTPGLRALQNKKPLTDIVQAVNGTMDRLGKRKPLYIKVAPDLSKLGLDDVIDVVLSEGATGIIGTNTTTNESIKAKYGQAGQPGGVSGDDPDFRKMATEKIAHIYKVTGGRMDIIGVGGIKDADTAWEKMVAGARAVQIVTALRSEGPSVAGRINRGLIERMDREGVQNISEIVGSDAY